MPNFYKKALKLSFRGNFPLMNDKDVILRDPYAPKKREDGPEMKMPGDQDTNGFGTDYMPKAQPPSGIKVKDDRSIRGKWQDSFDGEDPDKNDAKPVMNSGDKFYDDDSPLSPLQRSMSKIDGEDRDNTAVGPHNQKTISENFFDKVRRRLN
jgi:hypothetical protein